MGWFSKKKTIGLEEFCADFYERNILNPVVGEINVGETFVDVVVKEISEVDPAFIDFNKRKLAEQLMIIRFELFALAWTHKFISGKIVVAQSAFTKHYLHDKGRDDIWDGMKSYNDIIDGATLHWLTNLGKMNLSFNYHMREDLTAENIKDAKELGIKIDESIERVNNRLWSANAWRQKIIIGPLVATFCSQIHFNSSKLNREALLRLSFIIRGLYDGAEQSWDNVKITL